MRNCRKYLFLALAVAGILFAVSTGASAQPGVVARTGTLPDGASFVIEVPANWNGTLFLYSHGYVVPGSANPAQDVGDPATRFFMLASGFALAGSSYAVLDAFSQIVGKPKRTIAWGHSLGGMITAGLIQRHPDRFDAAPAFVEFHPGQYLRPFDAEDKDRDND